MTLPNAAPGSGPTRGWVHFQYRGTAPGTSWHAYIAGPAQWFLTHNKKPSKPCLHILTSGKLECPRCGSGPLPVEMGYVPVYRAVDGQPTLVIVYGEERQVLDRMATHSRVLIGREDSIGDRVWIRPALSQTPTYSTTLPLQQVAADCTETLLKLWAYPQLTEWYRNVHCAARPVPEVSAPRAVRSDGKPFTPMLQAAADRVSTFVPAVPETAEAFDSVVKNLATKAASLAPSSNGRKKPR